RHTIKKDNATYFLTLTTVGWVDIFTRKNHSELILSCLRYHIKQRELNVYAYCIMSNHIHIIVNCDPPNKLSDIIRDFKRYTSKALIQAIKNKPESRREWMLDHFMNIAKEHSKTQHFKVWKDGNHAIELYSEKFTWEKINYIHQNPIKAGYVVQPEHWIYSSASNYMQMDSILKEVVRLKPMLRSIK
ncbi:MAG: transposase, partial [Crocinitomicaceae bacterium]|nr:transposase [Crocinitomicaceae bacterium]